MTHFTFRRTDDRHNNSADAGAFGAAQCRSRATAEGKATWRSWDLFCLWMTSAHSLGSYTFAIGMLALGLSGWQTMLALFVGVLGLWLGSNLIGVAGQKVGVPFPVFARATFGIFGANIPALLRGLVAVFWYGIQTYLASLAVIVLIVRIWPGMESWTTGGFLGQSPLGWITFMVLWAVQLLVLSYGMEIVRKASDFAGPVVWIGMIALAIWMLEQADWSINWHARVGDVLSLPSTIAAFVAVAFLMIAYMAGPLVNYADFARFAPSKKAIKRGNALGIPLNETAFVVLSIIISLCSLKVFGDGTLDPVALVSKIDSNVVVVIAAVLFAIATVGINIVLNFVSPSYDISNVAPKYISFRTGGIITAVLSIVVLPWKVWGSETAIVYFLGGVGSLMGRCSASSSLTTTCCAGRRRRSPICIRSTPTVLPLHPGIQPGRGGGTGDLGCGGRAGGAGARVAEHHGVELAGRRGARRDPDAGPEPVHRCGSGRGSLDRRRPGGVRSRKRGHRLTGVSRCGTIVLRPASPSDTSSSATRALPVITASPNTTASPPTWAPHSPGHSREPVRARRSRCCRRWWPLRRSGRAHAPAHDRRPGSSRTGWRTRRPVRSRRPGCGRRHGRCRWRRRRRR